MYNFTLMAENAAASKYDIDEVIRFLHNDFPIRTVKEELEKLIEIRAIELGKSQDDIIKILKNKCGNVNVNNWLGNKARALSRESAIKLAFALQMDYKTTSWFLMQNCWLDGFYMRDYKDVIYRYCLDKKMEYEQAEKIINNHSYLDNIPNPDVADNDLSGIRVTEFLDNKFKSISSESGLDDFIEQNKEYFGSFRRKAYELFMLLYDEIKAPTNDDDLLTDKEICSDEEICNVILMNIPSLKGRQTIMGDVLKKIAEDTLSRTTLSEIAGKQEIKRKREIYGKITEVKRKHLLLMWLYVNAGKPDFNDNAYSDREAALRECIDDINCVLLEPCGMPLIDPRNPFDWVIMNALNYAYFTDDTNENSNALDEDNDAVERIKNVMAQLFNQEG